MKIDKFITESIKGIAKGIANAHKENDIIVNPRRVRLPRNSDKMMEVDRTLGIHSQIIDFDLAVVVSEESKTKGKAGIFIASMGLGIKGESNISTSLVNHIKFSIPVVLTSPQDIEREH